MIYGCDHPCSLKSFGLPKGGGAVDPPLTGAMADTLAPLSDKGIN